MLPRRPSRAFAALLAALLLLGCDDDRNLVPAGGRDTPDGGREAGADAGPHPDAGADGAYGDGGADAGTLQFLRRLESPADYARVAGPGAEVKWLTRVDGRTPVAPLDASECVFQNSRVYEYHLVFLWLFPEHASLTIPGYADLVLRKASRSMWGGRLQLFAATPHPVTGRPGIVAYRIYSADGPAEALSAANLIEIDGHLKRCAPYAADTLVLVPEGPEQIAHFDALAGELSAAGVAMVQPEALDTGLSAQAYSVGEAYGYLKIVPPGETAEAVSPRDVVVTEAAPNDLTLVAGLVTKLPQSLGSHVTLRLREKGIPNASVPDIYDNAIVTGMADRLVHLTVTETSVTIDPADLEDAEAFWALHHPDVGQPVADLSVTALRPFPEMRHADVTAFGAKAANLGELHSILPPENRMEGFGIPFSAYADFAAARGIDARVAAFLADPAVATDAIHKRAGLKALRDAIRAADLLPEFVTSLEASIRAAYGDAGLTTRLRFRSSTNAEDLPGITGAGLYDSRSGCLADDLDGDAVGPSRCLTPEITAYLEGELARRRTELTDNPDHTYLADIIADLEDDLANEKSAWLAVRRVWASLWNERAFDDREYYGLDHEKVYMAIAVHPTLVGEQLESVIVTNLQPEMPEPLYRLVSQAGEVGVVRPSDPFATSEVLTFRRSASDTASDVQLVAPSSLSPGGARLWSEPALTEIASLLFLAQDHFQASVYPEIQPLLLDLEVDVSMDGRILVKQARPYVEAGL